MSQIDNRRLAKNTIMLYGRTAFTLIISLFTSRLTLQALGVDNYGISNAVGGVIALLEIVSGSMESSISRYITFELGHGDFNKLKRTFSTAVNIQLILGLIVVMIAETVGVWFLNAKMNIPAGRMVAANWVLQCAIITFFVSITQVPYSACVIGHEKMSFFAVLGISRSVLRLIIVCLLFVLPYDKLIMMSILLLMAHVIIQLVQRFYCIRFFQECEYSFVIDKSLLGEMMGYTSWNFLTNGAWVLSNQGVNVLINLFFGVAYNAARGVAVSLEAVVKKFVNDFMMAMNPQITKSYAAGDFEEMNMLVCRGTRFAYYLMLVFALPLLFEAYNVLHLWLGVVPDYSVLFFRLSVIGTLIVILGQTSVTAVMASGDIKWYCIIITIITIFVTPLTYLFYKLGYPVEISYVIFIITYGINDIVRLVLMKKIWGFPILLYVRETLIPVILVTILSFILPLIIRYVLDDSIVRFILTIIVSFFSSIIVIYSVGLKKSEKELIVGKALQYISKDKLRKF